MTRIARTGIVGLLAGAIIITGLAWLGGSRNPETPAGYVGYLTQGAVLGKTHYYGLQTGPTSPGRTWLLKVVNISITPYTYNEEFVGENSVLSKDNLKIGFRVHLVWKIRPDKVKEFVEQYAYGDENDPDKLVRSGYDNFLKEPLRTYARDEVQRLNGLDIKDKISPIGDAIFERIKALAKDTPYEVTSVVVGNVQYPVEVADAVAQKLATTQILERKNTEVEIEKAEAKKRVTQAQGIAEAMELIQAKLTPFYLQHEAIDAQKSMVNSPNHTVVYIPVGNMGVPLVGTFSAIPEESASSRPPATPK
jgi:regulator of protease activity HflC (stomatin/prohibitin superfamily)